MTLGFHAPMPPARTGVADYAAAMARMLRRGGMAMEVNPGRACDAELYHIGNNALHRDIYGRALERPGVALMHDAVLQHFFLGFGDEGLYTEEFVYNYGEWNRGLAAALWRERAGSAADPRYFEYPMLARIARTSRAVLVHNPGAAAMVRAHAPEAEVIEMPHLFEAPETPAAYEVFRLREAWGVGAGAVVFGVFGHLRESKRLKTVLDVFPRVRAARPDAWLLVAGDFVSAELGRALGPALAQPGVIRVPYLENERAFWLHAHAVDACINLRYPTAGETSGITVRMMGIGKAVLVTAGAETSPLPEAACVRVDAGAPEAEMLAAYLLWLAAAPDAVRRIGEQAAAYVRAAHAAERVVEAVRRACGWGVTAAARGGRVSER